MICLCAHLCIIEKCTHFKYYFLWRTIALEQILLTSVLPYGTHYLDELIEAMQVNCIAQR